MANEFVFGQYKVTLTNAEMKEVYERYKDFAKTPSYIEFPLPLTEIKYPENISLWNYGYKFIIHSDKGEIVEPTCEIYSRPVMLARAHTYFIVQECLGKGMNISEINEKYKLNQLFSSGYLSWNFTPVGIVKFPTERVFVDIDPHRFMIIRDNDYSYYKIRDNKFYTQSGNLEAIWRYSKYIDNVIKNIIFSYSFSESGIGRIKSVEFDTFGSAIGDRAVGCEQNRLPVAIGIHEKLSSDGGNDYAPCQWSIEDENTVYAYVSGCPHFYTDYKIHLEISEEVMKRFENSGWERVGTVPDHEYIIYKFVRKGKENPEGCGCDYWTKDLKDDEVVFRLTGELAKKYGFISKDSNDKNVKAVKKSPLLRNFSKIFVENNDLVSDALMIPHDEDAVFPAIHWVRKKNDKWAVYVYNRTDERYDENWKQKIKDRYEEAIRFIKSNYEAERYKEMYAADGVYAEVWILHSLKGTENPETYIGDIMWHRAKEWDNGVGVKGTITIVDALRPSQFPKNAGVEILSYNTDQEFVETPKEFSDWKSDTHHLSSGYHYQPNDFNRFLSEYYNKNMPVNDYDDHRRKLISLAQERVLDEHFNEMIFRYQISTLAVFGKYGFWKGEEGITTDLKSKQLENDNVVTYKQPYQWFWNWGEIKGGLDSRPIWEMSLREDIGTFFLSISPNEMRVAGRPSPDFYKDAEEHWGIPTFIKKGGQGGLPFHDLYIWRLGTPPNVKVDEKGYVIGLEEIIKKDGNEIASPDTCQEVGGLLVNQTVIVTEHPWSIRVYPFFGDMSHWIVTHYKSFDDYAGKKHPVIKLLTDLFGKPTRPAVESRKPEWYPYEFKIPKVTENPAPKEKDYGEWGDVTERIVYQEDKFIIVRYPAHTKTGFCYQVVPVRKGTIHRLGDREICPEPDTFEKAIKLLEKTR